MGQGGGGGRGFGCPCGKGARVVGLVVALKNTFLTLPAREAVRLAAVGVVLVLGG